MMYNVLNTQTLKLELPFACTRVEAIRGCLKLRSEQPQFTFKVSRVSVFIGDDLTHVIMPFEEV